MKRFSTRLNGVQFIAIALVTAASIVVVGFGLDIWISSLNTVSLADSNSSESHSASISPALPSPTVPSSLQPVAVVPERSPQALPASPISSPQTSSLSQAASLPLSQTSTEATTQIRTSFGHLPYQENDPSRLVEAGRFVRENYERTELLDVEAEEAFRQMLTEARAAGIALMPLSGFRSIAAQQVLFTRQIQRQGSAEAAARLSAPPGYSEHHTGYAIDIADEHQPDTDLKRAFQETDAYRWLQANAYKYGFEQSFPENNWQGISFEPWHWRFVLSSRAAGVFAVAKGSGD